MIRLFFQLVVALIPVYIFAIGICISTVAFADILTKWSYSNWIASMLLGVLVLAVVEGFIFRLWLLPKWAQVLSERFYGGTYFPADDPVASLAQSIIDQHCGERAPELEKLVLSDSTRTRGWMELARVAEIELKDSQKAAEYMLTGARKVPHKEDAAMLMWRAVTLLRKDGASRPRAEEIRHELIQRYPKTTYGRLAAESSDIRD